ncbi:MAG: sodium ion-translocating decarboxylase subunit beta, partial [Clostridiaceae bacterium]|nr:sodium ion-translocating decarboxylase subunit beta [Clostridiaceae bacterium]
SASSDTACIGMIGGADGLTAILFGESSQGKLSTACSALHFEPIQHDIEWRITFHEKRYVDFTLTLDTTERNEKE